VSISTNDLKNGMALDLPEGLVNVVEFQHVKPGKGGAFVRTKLKNVRTGAVIDRTFRADEKVTLAMIDKREMQFLYREGPDYVFMDNESYDQITVPAGSIGDAVNFLKEGDTAVLPMYKDEIVGVGRAAAGGLEVTATQRVGRAQGRDARNRPRGAGPAVRQRRRPREGRHSLQRLSVASLRQVARIRADPARRARTGPRPRVRV
jgi:elongation factor P